MTPPASGLDSSTDDLAEVRAELAALRKEVAVLRAATPATPAAGSEDHGSGGELDRTSDRRGFFKLAGAAAAGAVVASTVAGAQPAAAATGGSLLIGQGNSPTAADDTTTLSDPSSTELSDQLLRVNNFSLGSITLPTNHAIAVAATTSGVSAAGRYKTGVYARTDNGSSGTNTGQGVFGSTDGVENEFTTFRFGVVGTAGAGGFGGFFQNDVDASSVGCLGRANLGTGVIGASISGVSLFARDGGRILQQLRVTSGAPAIGTFAAGEVVRDSLADMYICTAGGTPGTWRKVTAQHPNFASAGGSINLLSTPIRIFDSRGGAPLPAGAGARINPNVNTAVQVTGTTVTGISVPAGAKGAIGNITVVDAVGGGFVKMFPSGSAEPGTSAVNYVAGSQAVANSFTCGLGAANGQLVLRVGVSAVHVLLDIVGFVF